jgi:predicted nuclease of predicted toxin-antitoxin system
MRSVADMGISNRVILWLRKQGHDAVHLRDEGLQRLPNGQIFRKAIEENRIVLTFDLDFGEITTLSKKAGCSTIISDCEIHIPKM